MKSIGEGFSDFLVRNPRILEYTIENIDEVVRYLCSIGINNVGKVVRKYPAILVVDLLSLNALYNIAENNARLKGELGVIVIRQAVRECKFKNLIGLYSV